MNYAQKLKEYREKNGLKKAEMARSFGVDWQTYHNWERRESVPKEYYLIVEEFLSANEASFALTMARRKLEELSPAGLNAALRSISAIADLEHE
jgi:transcriptional regulator with XRE-family HTH domain